MKETGGSAIECRICHAPFIQRQWQVKKHDYRCLPCKRLAQNALNESKGDLLSEEAKASYQRRKETIKKYWLEQRKNPLHLKKRAARRKVLTEIHAGRLNRGCCEICGKDKADAHHHDYDQALDIRWLCRRCHFKEEGHAPEKRV